MLRRRFLLLFVSCLGLGSVTALGQPHTSIAAEPNGWTTGTSMPDVRSAHVAVRLRDGRVLVVGGYNSSGPTTDSWMFDPSSNGGMGSWAAMKPSQSAHPSGATATLLADGKVLVDGGYDAYNPGYWGPAEVYDPIGDEWTYTVARQSPGLAQTATLLKDGLVLITGGVTHYSQPGAETYDALSDSWRTTQPMSTPRFWATATRLADGRVLVSGGYSRDPLGNLIVHRSAEIYDSASNAWSLAASMSTPRYTHAAVLLSDGKVLVAGGGDVTDAFASSEVYDPTNDTWSTTSAPMHYARSSFDLVLLSTSEILVAGGGIGDGAAAAEVFHPASGLWTDVASLAYGRVDYNSTTLLADGRVMVAGGLLNAFGWPRTARVEFYSPAPTGGSITTHVFHDQNKNGQRDAGEALEGWTVNLYEGSSCTGTPKDFKLTNASGEAAFDGLAPGNYAVKEVVQPGWVLLGHVTTESCEAVRIEASEPHEVVFQNLLAARIFVQTFEDTDGDRVRGAQEPAGARLVHLYRGPHCVAPDLPGGNPGSDGVATFSGLLPEVYSISLQLSREDGPFRCLDLDVSASGSVQTVDLGARAETCSAERVLPAKPATPKANAVVIVHGWNGVFRAGPNTHADLRELRKEIATSITGAGRAADWDVLYYDWSAYSAGVPLLGNLVYLPGGLENGGVGGEAEARGGCLASILNSYQKVHVVAHSAGTWLADDALRRLRVNKPGTTVQLTLLDAYVPGRSEELGWWKQAGDAFEQYVDSRGLDGCRLLGAFRAACDVAGLFAGVQTNATIPSACNFDVTELDGSRFRRLVTSFAIPGFRGHEWPIAFYRQTIADSTFGSGRGYPVAPEAGGLSAPCQAGSRINLSR